MTSSSVPWALFQTRVLFHFIFCQFQNYAAISFSNDFFFTFKLWLTVFLSEAAGQSGVIRETMDMSLLHKQDWFCCFPDRRHWKRKGLWERKRETERETDKLDADIGNVRGRITSLLLGCTQGCSWIQIPHSAIMHLTQTLYACNFYWLVFPVIWIC